MCGVTRRLVDKVGAVHLALCGFEAQIVDLHILTTLCDPPAPGPAGQELELWPKSSHCVNVRKLV